MSVDQAALAANEAVAKMATLRSEVQHKREQDQKKVEDLREQNKKMVEKAAAAYQAKKDGKTAAPPTPAQPREEPKYTFFDTEDEYAVPDQPAPQAPPMPEFTPPPKPTPRRHARPAVDEDDDYSNQSWLQ